MIGIRFLPWGLTPFLLRKGGEIKDRCLDPEDVFGGKINMPRKQLYPTREMAELPTTIDRFLLTEIYRPAQIDSLATDRKSTVENGL